MAVSLEKVSTIDLSNINWGQYQHNAQIHGGLSINAGPATFTDWSVSSTSYDEILERVTAIEERLAIVVPNETLQKKYPALQEAYDAYKLIEKLVKDSNS